jgi:hypothetical protein
MQVEDQEYTREEFKKYIIDHSDEILKGDPRRRWLKIYCILVSDDNWKNNLFNNAELKKLGDIFKVSKKNVEENKKEQYYIEEYCPGLLLVYNTATDENYERHIGDAIDHNIGTTRMWMKPDVFDIFWRGILSETDGLIYRFASRRSSIESASCKLRPEYFRRVNYTGNDGTQTLAEFEEQYGVSAESVYMQIDTNLKIHVTNDGLFSSQQISSLALDVFLKYLENIKDKILEMRDISQALKFEITDDQIVKTILVEPGVIKFSEIEMDQTLSQQMIKSMDGFSFIHVHEEFGSFSLIATVIDEMKGSIFDINASNSEILIVPKFRVTFESFIKFYRGIVEAIDENAVFSLIN